MERGILGIKGLFFLMYVVPVFGIVLLVSHAFVLNTVDSYDHFLAEILFRKLRAAGEYLRLP